MAKPPLKKETATRGFILTVDDEHLQMIASVAEQLRSRGARIDSVMEATGMISGSTALAKAELERIPGVFSVEEQAQFQLPPFDSPIQ